MASSGLPGIMLTMVTSSGACADPQSSILTHAFGRCNVVVMPVWPLRQYGPLPVCQKELPGAWEGDADTLPDCASELLKLPLCGRVHPECEELEPITELGSCAHAAVLEYGYDTPSEFASAAIAECSFVTKSCVATSICNCSADKLCFGKRNLLPALSLAVRSRVRHHDPFERRYVEQVRHLDVPR